ADKRARRRSRTSEDLRPAPRRTGWTGSFDHLRDGTGPGGDRSGTPVPGAEERYAVEHSLLEPFQVEVDDRRDVQGDELRHDEPADDDQAERPARGAVGAEADRDRHGAD